MAFEEYGKKSAGPDPNYISFGVQEVNGAMYLLVALGPTVVDLCNWKLGDRVALYFGTEEDKGKLLIKTAENGGKLTLYGKKSKTGTSALKVLKAVKPVKPIEDFINKPMEAVRINYDWDEVQEGIVLDIPDGFFAG